MRARAWLIAAGGAAGAVARVAVTDLVPHLGAVPLATLLINVLGATLLGVLLARTDDGTARHGRLQALLGVGALGAFTTFSALSLQLVTMPAVWAVAYGATTLALGLGGAALGLRARATGRRS